MMATVKTCVSFAARISNNFAWKNREGSRVSVILIVLVMFCMLNVFGSRIVLYLWRFISEKKDFMSWP